MSKQTENSVINDEKFLLNVVKNIAGECFLNDTDRKISNLVSSAVFDGKTCASVEPLTVVLNSLKLILEIVDNSCGEIRLVTGLNDILEFLRDVFDQKIDQVTSDALNLVTTACKFCAKNDYVEILAKFYLFHLHLVAGNVEDDVRQRLCVLGAIFSGILQTAGEEFLAKFREECRQKNDYVVESQLFTRLILSSHDAISAQTLLTVLPGFVKIFNAPDVLLTISNKSLHNDVDDSKRYAALCQLFDMLAGDDGPELQLLLQDERFWFSVQAGLTSNANIIRRQALFLFKRSVHESSNRKWILASHKLSEISGKHFVEKLDDGQIKLCNGLKNVTVCNSKMFLVVNDGDPVMWWHPDFNDELGHLFNDVFLTLETLEEKQAHIVKPILPTVIRLFGPTAFPFRNGKCLHISWILVLFQRILDHDNASIVRWGLVNLISLDINLLKTEEMLEKFVKLLVSYINCSAVFQTDLQLVRNELDGFFRGFEDHEISKPFFRRFIQEIFSTKWSPEPLFILTDCLQNKRFPAITLNELDLIRKFVSTAIATQYTFLRAAVQCNILNLIINLSDVTDLNLDSLSETFFVFRREECLARGTKLWRDLAQWIEGNFTKRQAEEFILKREARNPETFARMVCLLYDAHLFGIMKCCGEAPSDNIIATFTNLFLKFRDADKRLYADSSELIFDLKIIRGILKEHLTFKTTERSHLLEFMLPRFPPIFPFIACKLSTVTADTADLFTEILQLILQTQKIYGINSEKDVNVIFNACLREINGEPVARCVSISCIKSTVTIVYQDAKIPHLKLLRDLIKSEMNQPLARGDCGRLNEIYLTNQWCLINRLRTENLLAKNLSIVPFFTDDALCSHAIHAVTLGGAQLLQAVLESTEQILPDLSEESRERLVDALWTAVWELRRSDAFVASARRFISVVFQPELFRTRSCQQLLIKYSFVLLSDSINGLANALMTHAQSLKIKYTSCELWLHLLAAAAVFGGSATRRDDRLTQEVSALIAATDNSANELVINDWNTNREVRARALQLLLTLTPDLAEQLVGKLIERDREVSAKKKSRTFSGSASCLLRSRILQTFLTLEPLLKKESLLILYEWACQLLLRDSQQPIIRYLTEWLIVRILCKNVQLFDALWSNFTEALEQRIGSLCSFISIVYHSLTVLPEDNVEKWLDRAFMQFLPYCLSQHFTLRLYAQVAIDKMWLVTEAKSLTNLLEKYRIMRQCQLRAIGGGNSVKNAEKLANDFYWTVFHPLNHYSLQTIYRDLPRLAHIKPDEWITPDLMAKVGISNENNILPWSSGDTLWQHPISEWTIRNEETNLEIVSENLQKKLIPVKSLLPDYEQLLTACGNSTIARKRTSLSDGLIVVASLIDRPANLGGLSRTCEAFGVSELIVDSLKILDDKQFQSLSVTAEKWLTITEIKCHHLSDYILQMKTNGYRIIGAEQTTKSRPLHETQFPPKSILLLGSEKEGVPAQLLPLLDICVEVPQLGFVRSLNVHVTAALFVWEYTKQHGKI